MLKRAITQSQFDALFSFYYNRGASSGFKAAVAALNAGDVAGAAKAIADAGDKEGVAYIAERRLREAAQFLADSAGVSKTTMFWVAGGIAGVLLLGLVIAKKRKNQRQISVTSSY